MILRLRYTKTGKVRWISHRDVARVWERALRRAQVPVAYTEGFSPRPKVSFGLALSTGYESHAEYLDVHVPDDSLIEQAELPTRLTSVLPAGVDCHAVATVDRAEDSLQQAVTSCAWLLRVAGQPHEVVAERVQRLLDATHVPYQRVRKGKEVTDDLRPCILHLAVADVTPDEVVLDAEIATTPRAVKPGELIAALGPDLYEVPGCRTHQWIGRNGARKEPVEVPAAATSPDRHAEERAS